MKKRLVALLLLLPWAGAAAAPAGPWTLTQAEWSGVTRAGQVVAIKPLQAAVSALDADPGARLVVVHNGGEDGLFWASELEGWLVSLGVPSARIEDRIGAIGVDRIRIEIEPAGGG